METRHAHGKMVWIDLECPSQEELSSVMREFDVDERVHQEISRPTPYPLCIAFPGYSYLILHFPVTGSEDGARSQEVDFIAGQNFLITVRYEIIEPLYVLHRAIEAEELLGTQDPAFWRPGALIETVLGRMYVAISEDIETAGRRLERVERDIFSGRERRTVRAISDAARVLLRFETTLARHREPLADFLASLATPAFLGTRFDSHAAHIEARRVHAASLVSSYRAVAHELRTTNDSLLSASQNQVTKTLTALALTGVPLTLIASVFGMNVPNMPIVGSEHGFLKVLGLMAAATVLSLLYFRARRWL